MYDLSEAFEMWWIKNCPYSDPAGTHDQPVSAMDEKEVCKKAFMAGTTLEFDEDE